MDQPKGEAIRPTKAREFVRSLNVVLKSVRLYGMDHVGTSAQLEAAWKSLSALLPGENNTGLMLAAAGPQLLVDGVAVEGTVVEKSFAEMLSASGLASLHFTARTSRDDFAKLVRALGTAGGKSTGLAEQLKAALGESADAAIRVNRVRFVASDSEVAGASTAGMLVTQGLTDQAEKLKDWLHDPQKLLQLIAAAEGAEAGARAPAAAAPPAQAPPAGEEDVMRVMRLLAQMAQAGAAPGAIANPAQFQKSLSEISTPGQVSIQQALTALAATQTAAGKPRAHMLIQLAEQLAIRHALQRFERGEARVDAVREMLQRVSREIDGLRKILGTYEEKMSRAGLAVESHAEILDRQFWAQVPESAKRDVLLSPEAWCIPPKNVATYVEQLQGRGEVQSAAAILRNYASCTRAADVEPRRKAAAGLAELAKHYAAAGEESLDFAVSQAGRQLRAENDAEVRAHLKEAFGRLALEATAQKRYRVVGQVLTQVQNIQDSLPEVSQELRSRMALDVRIQDFLEDALRREQVPPDLLGVLRQVPRLAVEQSMARFARCTRREECVRLAEIVRATGEEGIAVLNEALARGANPAAVSAVGLLSIVSPASLESGVSPRLAKWDRPLQSQLIRQMAMGGSPDRAFLLMKWLPQLDALLWPEALDEIGMSRNRETSSFLLQIASGELPKFQSPYLVVKAIEALGRMRDDRAAPLLHRLIESKKMWAWEQPPELRLVAAQALAKIEPAWQSRGLAATGLTSAQLNLSAPLDPEQSPAWSRHRRYPRLMLALALPAVAASETRRTQLNIRVLNLGGGLASSDMAMPGGTMAHVDLRSGLRSIRAQVLIHEIRREQLTFEIVGMDFAERFKLRKLLAGLETVAV